MTQPAPALFISIWFKYLTMLACYKPPSHNGTVCTIFLTIPTRRPLMKSLFLFLILATSISAMADETYLNCDVTSLRRDAAQAPWLEPGHTNGIVFQDVPGQFAVNLSARGDHAFTLEAHFDGE